MSNRAGFDGKKLSRVGKGYHTEDHPVGYCTTRDRVKTWGGAGALWGGLRGLLRAPAMFFLPGLGRVGMAGPRLAARVGALEGAVVVGGVSALGAALSQIGMPKDQFVKHETALKADKQVLLVHRDANDLTKAQSGLANATASASVAATASVA